MQQQQALQLSNFDEEEMWTIAKNRFSQEPYSNGYDKRYETVKAELRAKYGRYVINESNKPRLKAIAVNRGTEVKKVDQKKMRRPSWKRAGCRIKDLTTTALEALVRVRKKDNSSPPSVPMVIETQENKTSEEQEEGLTSSQCRGLALGLDNGGRSLRSISVKSTKIDDDGLTSLLAYSWSHLLQRIDCSHCEKITDLGLGVIATRCTKSLQTLKLARCAGLSDDGIILLARLCHRLRHVDVRRVKNLTDRGARSLVARSYVYD